MSRILFKISAGFLVAALTLVAGSLYAATLHMQDQQQLVAAGDTEGALEAASAAARFDPFGVEPLQGRAALLQNEQRPQEAEAALRQAIQREPSNYSLYASLGNVQMSLEKYEAAERNFLEARRLNPRSDASAASLAQSLVRSGKLEEAREEYERLLETRQIDTFGLYDLGRILVRTGDAERGYTTINQARLLAELELENLEEPVRSQQEDAIESMKLAAADALVVQRRYIAADSLISESGSEQAPALLELISADPEAYRQSVVDSEIY